MKHIWTILFLLTAGLAMAHGDLDAQIKKVTKQIEKDPTNAELYVKRGKLFFQHEEFKRSIIDFEHAKSLGIHTTEIEILFARSYFKADKHKIALEYLHGALSEQENHVVANRLTGQINVDLRMYTMAADHLHRALDYSEKRIPEHYIELANCYLNMNTSEAVQHAVEILNRGINDLGELIVFLNKLVYIHKQSAAYEQAILVQSRIVAVSKRKELPYFYRAQLHLQNKNTLLAIQDLDNTRKTIIKLPKRLSRSDEMQRVLIETQRLLNELEAD